MSGLECKRSDLINRLVLNYQTTESVGKLDNILLDLQNHQIKGLTSKSGLLGRERCYFFWNQVETIGKDSILVTYESEVEIKSSESVNTLVGAELWTDSGNKIGAIVDYIINTESGKVITYLFASNGWGGMGGGLYSLSPEDVINLANKRLIVRHEAVENAEQYSKGIGDRINQVTEFIKDDFEQTKKDLHLGKKEEKNKDTVSEENNNLTAE